MHTSGIAGGDTWTSGVSSGVIDSLIIAVAGVLHSDARDEPHQHASAVVDSRMPTTVSCDAKKTKERGSIHHVYTSHALMLVCACACTCVYACAVPVPWLPCVEGEGVQTQSYLLAV